VVHLESNEHRLLHEVLEREFGNVMRMMRAFPHERVDQHPVDCPHTARELAWRFVIWERLAHYLLLGRTSGVGQAPPRTMKEIMRTYDEAHQETRLALLRISGERWKETVHGPVAPDQWVRAARGELLWMAWKALVHHGEHFAAHLRLAREEDAAGAARRDTGPVADAVAAGAVGH
jgi:hypothetical protein